MDYGAREVKNLVARYIQDDLAEFILDHPTTRNIHIHSKNNSIQVKTKIRTKEKTTKTKEKTKAKTKQKVTI
jgi:ATP-dependent Clp protease ATP-binding subunit ClpA